MSPVVRRNKDLNRFELMEDTAVVAFADFYLSDSVVTVSHVETEPARRGEGNAARLMRGLLDDLRAQDETIVPVCSYAAGFMADHPDDADLLAR